MSTLCQHERMKKPRVCIVSPAAAQANNGNWHTAARWRRFLAPVAEVHVALEWQGEPLDALIALHARRSAASIARFRDAHSDAPLALVLTGTDLYRDIEFDQSALHSLKCASHVVVLQDEGLARLDPIIRTKARVIVQSASARARARRDMVLPLLHGPPRHFDFVAVGHLREEKDPLTLMRAARLLPAASSSNASPIRIVHIGDALDDALANAARQTAVDCPRYRWLGGLPHDRARRWIARSRALVHMSRIEGGANVVIEAVRSHVPVLASRIDGNVGLLGRDYGGYFPVGDATALAALMQRFFCDPTFAAMLSAQCAAREPRFTPETERREVQRLLADMLSGERPQ